MEKLENIYWDTCVFIHRFKETALYLGALEANIARARAGKCRIVTSTITLVEVCKIPECGMLPIEQTNKILDFFRNDYVVLYQADRCVCEEAHHLTRYHKLLPMDAIHMATALIAEAGLFLTTDGTGGRRTGLLHFNGKIGNPPLRIEKPSFGAFLPLWSSEEGNRDPESHSQNGV